MSRRCIARRRAALAFPRLCILTCRFLFAIPLCYPAALCLLPARLSALCVPLLTASGMSSSSAQADGKAKAAADAAADLLDEDDEFEEFVADTWDAADEEAAGEQPLWTDDWDDDDVDDQFASQLRAELTRAAAAAASK